MGEKRETKQGLERGACPGRTEGKLRQGGGSTGRNVGLSCPFTRSVWAGLFSLQSLKVSVDPHITNKNGYLVPPAAQRPKFHPGTQGTLGEG